jgi:hypothetical protein
MGSSPSRLDPVVLPLIVGTSVADIGCGVGRWGKLIRSNFWEAGLVTPPVIDGFDAHPASVEQCIREGSYRSARLLHLPAPLGGQWDTVIACEVLEHLKFEDAKLALNELERAAKMRIIVSVPNWAYFREGTEGNPYEAHLCHMPRAYLRTRGFKLIGVGFGNPSIRGSGLMNKLGISRLLSGFSLIFPFFGSDLVAYKDITPK